MSDEVKIVFWTCLFNFLAIALARVLSHFEHKATAKQVSEIHHKLNGRGEDA